MAPLLKVHGHRTIATGAGILARGHLARGAIVHGDNGLLAYWASLFSVDHDPRCCNVTTFTVIASTHSFHFCLLRIGY